MSPYLLMLLVSTSASIMNMVPWAGPVGRLGAVLKMDPTTLWRPLIPLQLCALVLMAVLAVFLGLREKRRIAVGGESGVEPAALADAAPLTARTAGRYWFNLILTLAVIAVLVWGVVPAGLVFMVGASVALLVNFPEMKDQLARIKVHAPNALLMAGIILAAGSFLGVLNGTGMLRSIATDFVAIMPAGMSRYLHVVVGVLGVPLELVLNTDATYFALLPVLVEITGTFGVEPVTAAYALLIGNIIGTFISPFSPALWLGLGLAELDIGRHIRYSFGWVWAFSLVLLAAAMLLGIVRI